MDMGTWWLATLVMQGRRATTVLDASTKGERYITDGTGEGRSHAIASVTAESGGLSFRPMFGATFQVGDGSPVETLAVSGSDEHAVSVEGGLAQGPSTLYLRRSTPGMRSYHKLALTSDCVVSIGRAAESGLRYDSPWVSATHAQLACASGRFAVRDMESVNGTFVNGLLIGGGEARGLAYGDVVQVMDLTILVGRGYLSLNEPEGLTSNLGDLALPIDHGELMRRAAPATPADRIGTARQFWPAPRLMRTVHRPAYNVEEPPAAKKPDDSPAIMKMGPSFLMGLASIFMAANSVSRLMGGADVLSTAPSIAMCVSMLGGMILWPLISRRYDNKKTERDEEQRRSAYSDYLAALESTFKAERDEQAQILAENRVDARECLRRAVEQDSTLMNRDPHDPDFMQLRVGTGTLPLDADFRWPQKRFSVESDELVDMARRLSERPPKLEGAPIAIDLLEHWTCGIVGDADSRWAAARSLVCQMASLYSYRDVQIAAIVPRAERSQWEFLLGLPHALAEEGKTRLVASDLAGVRELGAWLSRTVAPRRMAEGNHGPVDFAPYVLVLCADRDLEADSDVLASLVELRENLGVSLLFLSPDIGGLPAETALVVELAQDKSRLYARSDVSGTEQHFAPDAPFSQAEALQMARALSRVDLGGGDEAFALPTSLGFLECLGAEDVSGLSVESRWAQADSSRSLAAQFGVDSRGMPAVLDPHESFDGPHGLVAGTTGSGKSEFLITWILSTCVRFPPEQVAFVLVDYKGGGLADAFDREGLELPHLAGTVTNLDGASVARSLASIQAELVRRQRMFADAKRLTGDATMDISSYQRHYAAGDLTEPMPHLFLVADEFAELKQQEPEFLDALVSAARIGRSLGVHLVLATQRPTGVVTDQISANSRFRVCLRVADASDSREMVRRPDAAALEGAGRLIMLVGYDERLITAQAAWAGGTYEPGEAKGDESVELCDASGARMASAAPAAERSEESGVTELDAVLGELRRAAAGRHVRRLWLPPLEAHPTVECLRKRYPDARKDDAPWELDPIVGELDDPARQEKRLLTLPLSREGNAVVYGLPGGGAEDVLTGVIYSLISEHDASEVAIYLMSFSASTLAAFKDAPQVGGLVSSADSEKAGRLLSFIEQEMRERQEELATYGGSFARYRDDGGKRPSILLAIDSISAFIELLPQYEERLEAILRDGPTMGVHCMMLAANSSAVKFRMRPSISLVLTVGLASEDEYRNVLGTMRGTAIPRMHGRGLVRMEKKLLTYQCAFVAAQGGNVFQTISATASELAEHATARAREIPVMPKVVLPKMLLGSKVAKGSLPYGITAGKLGIASFDFSESPLQRVVYSRARDAIPFVRALIGMASSAGWQVDLLDIAKTIGTPAGQLSFQTSDQQDAAQRFQDLSQGRAGEGHLVVISGVMALFTALGLSASRPVKEVLAGLSPDHGPYVLLVDNVSAVSYQTEPWFRSNLTQRDGLWVGAGADNQNAIGTVYGRGEKVDSAVRGLWGYAIEGGHPTLVHLLGKIRKGESK